jgi:hypothetical protein
MAALAAQQLGTGTGLVAIQRRLATATAATAAATTTTIAAAAAATAAATTAAAAIGVSPRLKLQAFEKHDEGRLLSRHH